MISEALRLAELERQQVRRMRDAADLAAHRTPPLPAPEQIYVDAGERAPASAQALAQRAEVAGFDAEVWYARGPKFHAKHGTLLGIVDSIAVTMMHADGRMAQAVWLDGKADRVRVWRAGEFPRAVAFTAGRNGAYTIRDWIEGLRGVDSGPTAQKPQETSEQGASAA